MSSKLRAVLLGAVALCALTPPLEAQTWSAEQEALLAVIEETWVENDATWVTRLTHPRCSAGATRSPYPGTS